LKGPDSKQGDKISEEEKLSKEGKGEEVVAVKESKEPPKKKKRNVGSRDAWTQTERSDYMLIKYKQK